MDGNADAPTAPTSSPSCAAIIDQLRGITSIVQWVPFNEGWGEYDPARIADLVKSWDPSRLVNNNSGSNCCGFDGGNGDVIDDHIYVGPGAPSLPDRHPDRGARRVRRPRPAGRRPRVVAGQRFRLRDGADAAALTHRYVADHRASCAT